MSKNSRYGSPFSTQSEASVVDDAWFKNYEKSLGKEAVEPLSKNKSVHDQIFAIMNKKSKFPSVEAAVEDMQARSGIKAYWEKTSKNNENLKIASEDMKEPEVFTKFPMIKVTLENYIRDTKGNIDLPAILEKIKGLFRFDGPQSKDWEDELFVKFVDKMNKDERAKHNNDTTDYYNLGKVDHSSDDVDPANTDAFIGLMPAKF